MRFLPLLLVGLLGSTGCYKNTMKTGMPPGTTHDIKAQFFLWGLAGEMDVNLQEVCPNGVSQIEESVQVGDAILGCLTCGILSPVSIQVRCASGAAYHLIPDESQQGTWVVPFESSPILEEGAGS
ncbi:MAG: hypothetical protein QGG40_17010 [Myxococcota bacterium]|nr:hypothetical protein [Myxococcota bacterium]